MEFCLPFTETDNIDHRVVTLEHSTVHLIPLVSIDWYNSISFLLASTAKPSALSNMNKKSLELLQRALPIQQYNNDW